MDYFNSVWFKASFGITALIMIYGVFAYFMTDKKRTDSLPIEEKMKLTRTLPKATLLCKIGIFMLPIYLFVIPPIYKLESNLAYEIMAGLTVMYAGLLVGFMLFKRLLAALQ
jgi:hypothetical protein